METKKKQLVLADAHACSRFGLYQILSNAGFRVVAEAESLEECKTVLASYSSSLLMIAHNLLPPNPLPIIANLHQQYPDMRCVLILAECDSIPLHAWGVENHSGKFYLRQLVGFGVFGVILKCEPPEQLITAVRTVSQDQPWFSSPLLKQALQTDTISLTEEEVALLRLMVSGETERQMGAALGKSRRTVRRRLRNICTKLGVETNIEAAYLAGLRRLLPE